jgi:hypothetical protein
MNKNYPFYNIHYIKPKPTNIIPSIDNGMWDYNSVPIIKNLYSIRYNVLNSNQIKNNEIFRLNCNVLYHISHINTKLYNNITNNELYYKTILYNMNTFRQYSFEVHTSITLDQFKQFFLCYNNTGDLI